MATNRKLFNLQVCDNIASKKLEFNMKIGHKFYMNYFLHVKIYKHTTSKKIWNYLRQL
jgi:hypothetical protein